MKKILFFILFLKSFLSAEILISFTNVNTLQNTFLCVKSYSLELDKINYIDLQNNNNSFLTSGYSSFNFDDTYTISENKCSKSSTYYMGLNYQNFNFLMALFGLLLGNTILLIFSSAITRR